MGAVSARLARRRRRSRRDPPDGPLGRLTARGEGVGSAAAP